MSTIKRREHNGPRGSQPRPIKWERRGECIIVTSHAHTKAGYVVMGVSGLHRIVCERRHGPLGDLVTRHTCDNPGCVNPNHLIPGTQGQNVHDTITRGRSNIGERSGTAKLTNEQVLAIRAHPGTPSEIAQLFGISQPHVTGIRSRKFWKHLPEQTPLKLHPIEEVILCQNAKEIDPLKGPVEALIIIRCQDESGNEWEFKGLRRFNLVPTSARLLGEVGK